MRYSTAWGFALSTFTHFPLEASALPTNDAKPLYAPACVLGAGPAGLTAASRLQEKGIDAIVFEKQAEIGGKCQSYYDDE
jgi:hypothetical protein